MIEEIPQDAIHQAAADGNVNLIQQYLTKDPSLVSRLHSTLGTIPLIHAITADKVEAVEYLLEVGSPLDFVDKKNNKILMHFTKEDSKKSKGKPASNKQLTASALSVVTACPAERIRCSLEDKILQKFNKLNYNADTIEKIQSLIILLLNLIFCCKHHSLEKEKFLTELELQTKRLKNNSATLPPKDKANFYKFIAEICKKELCAREALSYYQDAIRACLRAIGRAQTNEEKKECFKIISNIYAKLADIMYSTLANTLKKRKKNTALIDTLEDSQFHQKSYELLQALLTQHPEATAELADLIDTLEDSQFHQKACELLQAFLTQHPEATPELAELYSTRNTFVSAANKLISLHNQSHLADPLFKPVPLIMSPGVTIPSTNDSPAKQPPQTRTSSKRPIKFSITQLNVASLLFLGNHIKQSRFAAKQPEAKPNAKRVRFADDPPNSCPSNNDPPSPGK